MTPVITRRRLLSGGLAAGIGAVAGACGVGPTVSMPPGVAGDGFSDDTAALQHAIDRTSGSSRPVLRLPPGRYLCGTLHLRSRLTLQLMAGAVIVASPRLSSFSPVEILGYDPFADPETADQHFAVLAGDGVEHLTIAGPGALDGNRPTRGGPKLIGLKRCRNVRITGVRLLNSPNYAVSLLGCDHVEVSKVEVINSYADGIDPDCCSHVRITDCHVDSADDGICVKASLSLGRPVTTSNIVVERCVVRSSTNGLKIGTETGSDVTDVTFRNCTLLGRPLPNASVQAEGGGVAIEMVDGAVLDGVTAERIDMQGVPIPIFIRLGARGRGQPPPVHAGALRNVAISQVTAAGASETSSITGLPGAPVQGVTLTSVHIAANGGGVFAPGLNVDEQPAAYPQVRMFGELPARGLYCRHVEDVVLDDVALQVARADPRPSLVVDDGSRLNVTSIAGLVDGGAHPDIWLNDVSGALVHETQTLSPVPSLRISGAGTAQILLTGWLASARAGLDVAPEVPAGAVSG